MMEHEFVTILVYNCFSIFLRLTIPLIRNDLCSQQHVPFTTACFASILIMWKACVCSPFELMEFTAKINQAIVGWCGIYLFFHGFPASSAWRVAAFATASGLVQNSTPTVAAIARLRREFGSQRTRMDAQGQRLTRDVKHTCHTEIWNQSCFYSTNAPTVVCWELVKRHSNTSAFRV